MMTNPIISISPTHARSAVHTRIRPIKCARNKGANARKIRRSRKSLAAPESDSSSVLESSASTPVHAWPLIRRLTQATPPRRHWDRSRQIAGEGPGTMIALATIAENENSIPSSSLPTLPIHRRASRMFPSPCTVPIRSPPWVVTRRGPIPGWLVSTPAAPRTSHRATTE